MNGQTLAWIFSTISNILFLFVFLPQLYQNYKNKNSEAISIILIFCLILGDIFSIISANIKDLNYVIIYAGIYHIILDIIIMCQIIYYRLYNTLIYENETLPLLGISNNLIENKFTYLKCLTLYEFLFILSSVLLILFIDNTIPFANFIAWVSTIIFGLSRIPQIILNFQRKSTLGLSFLSFFTINIANIFFLLSILIILIDLPKDEYLMYLNYNIQLIVGGFVTMLFDSVIFYQFYKYKNSNRNNLSDLDYDDTEIINNDINQEF